MYSDRRHQPTPDMRRYSLHGPTMGSRYTAVFLAESEFDEAAIAASLFDAVDGVDRQMSNWKPDSDLCRLNRSPVDQWIDVPRALADVLACALRVSRDSDGAFDIGLGELIDAWGFGAAGTRVDERRIRAVQAQAYRPAAELMDVDPVRSRVRKRAAITLNLSGIAKGYGVDCLARCLDGHGVAHYLVGIDGEMRARGVKPSGGGWTIAIEKPLRGVREVMSVMELSDAAIATSGDYRHCTEYKGRRYAHTMNGAVLEPSQNRLASVSVVAPTCMAADAWATALLVLGETQGVKLAQERGMDALFVLREGDGFRQVPVFPSMQ